MHDLGIFAFGLVVTVVVGSGLTSLIVTKNRAKAAQERGPARHAASAE